MDVMCDEDILQDNIFVLMGLEFLDTYLDDLLHLSKANLDDYLEHVEK